MDTKTDLVSGLIPEIVCFDGRAEDEDEDDDDVDDGTRRDTTGYDGIRRDTTGRTEWASNI